MRRFAMNVDQSPRASPRFLEGGGEMGVLLRSFDWSATELGTPSGWPQSLRTAVRLILNTGHPMYIFWGQRALCFYNDAYRTSIGPERHPSSLGQPARQVWAEIWDTIGPQVEQVMRGDGATWHENQLLPITRFGVLEQVYWTYSYGPIDDEAATTGVGGVLVVCTETTSQMELASQLTRSRQVLELALSGGRGIGTWVWDVVADRVIADERFARLYGVDPAKARDGAPVAEFFRGIHPDDLERVEKRIAQVLLTGDLFSEEYRLQNGGGPERWVLAEGRCEFDSSGKPLRFPGISFDISDRKLIEQRLRELNSDLEQRVIERTRQLGRTWKLSPELLGVLNADARFETSNPAWQSVLGWSETEVAERVFLDFIHPDDLERTTRAWDDALNKGLPALKFENRYVRKDGQYRWLSWVAVPESDKVYCSARDVTDEKEREAALLSAESSLRQAQKMEAVGQLTGGLAHTSTTSWPPSAAVSRWSTRASKPESLTKSTASSSWVGVPSSEQRP